MKAGIGNPTEVSFICFCYGLIIDLYWEYLLLTWNQYIFLSHFNENAFALMADP